MLTTTLYKGSAPWLLPSLSRRLQWLSGTTGLPSNLHPLLGWASLPGDFPRFVQVSAVFGNSRAPLNLHRHAASGFRLPDDLPASCAPLNNPL